MKTKTILTILITLLTFNGFAQSSNSETTEFKNRRSIRLKQQNKEEAVSMSVSPNTKEFNLRIRAAISEGKLTIEVYDAQKKKRGTFTVGPQLKSADSDKAMGTITKSMRNPAAGNWTIKVIPSNVTGEILIEAQSTL